MFRANLRKSVFAVLSSYLECLETGAQIANLLFLPHHTVSVCCCSARRHLLSTKGGMPANRYCVGQIEYDRCIYCT